jgi:hypothetical protein
MEALEKQLPRLRVEVPDIARVAGLMLRRGEARLGEGAWGEALPVDPGPHTLEVTAPGHQPRVYTFQARSGELTTVTIEPLARLPAALPSAAAAPPTAAPLPPTEPVRPAPTPPDRSTRRTAGYLVGGAGLLGLWVGGVFGVRAVLKRQDSDPDCPAGACNDRGWAAYEQARSSARVANVGLALGALGVGAGAWLLWTARPSTAVGLSPAGLSVHGRW